MNRTKKNTQIIAIAIIALALILILFSVRKIDYNVASIFGGIIGLSALVLCVFNPMSKTKEDRDNEKRERAFKKVKVQRSREGTIFEVATAIILVCSLIIGYVTHTFEQRDSFLNYYVGYFILAIAGLILAYHPLFFVSIYSSNRVTNEEQFKLLIRKNRVFAIAYALMALILSISHVENHLVMVIFICLIIAWIGTDFLFSFLHYKNK